VEYALTLSTKLSWKVEKYGKNTKSKMNNYGIRVNAIGNVRA
jgi:hypothetical protein